MTSREAILSRIRKSLGRRTGQLPDGLPSPLLLPRFEESADQRMQRFLTNLHALNVKTTIALSVEDVRDAVSELIRDKPAICAPAPVLEDCGIPQLESVDHATRPSAAAAGITGVDYAIANTGSLVMLSSISNPRMFSLLPPFHIAVVRESQLLSNLDELFAELRTPADITSSMVLITGPSRTADIEQILVRGVHGPGELHVVFLRN